MPTPLEAICTSAIRSAARRSMKKVLSSIKDTASNLQHDTVGQREYCLVQDYGKDAFHSVLLRYPARGDHVHLSNRASLQYTYTSKRQCVRAIL